MALDYHTDPCKLCLLLFSDVYLITNLQSGTSIDVEQVFSQGQLILPYICNQLPSESMHALLCFGNWSQGSHVKNSNIKAVAILPDIQGHKPPLVSGGWDN